MKLFFEKNTEINFLHVCKRDLKVRRFYGRGERNEEGIIIKTYSYIRTYQEKLINNSF